MKYVTDTHPLVWFLLNKYNLSPRVKEIFEKAEEGEAVIMIPSIVLLEILRILEKIEVRAYFKKTLEQFKGNDNYQIYPLNLKIVDSVSKIEKIGKIHDRK